jgi:muramoyltetrapeptide carboxypeptidase LdcA involved in peptidoglycan recycling
MNTSEEIEQAKKLLQDNGYQVANLWKIDDVQSKFKCDDDEALDVLESALVNDATMEQIWFAIGFHAEEDGLKPIEE